MRCRAKSSAGRAAVERTMWAVGLGASAFLTMIAGGSSAIAQGCPGRPAIERVSVDGSGNQGNDRSLIPAIDADGCVVAFKSSAANLVPNDRNEKVDVFVRDRTAGSTDRVDVTDIPDTQSNDNSFPPALDADGQVVAFASLASNLLRGDFNTGSDVFVYDRANQTTEILTLVHDVNGEGRGGGGAPDAPPGISGDGALVAFSSSADDLVSNDSNEQSDVFVFDRGDRTTTLLSVATVGSQVGRSANAGSAGAVISADGCVVAFFSDATNLVSGDTNQFRDVFVRDRCTGSTERVSVSTAGEQANGPSQPGGFPPSISADGRYVAFASDATNLVPGDTNGVADIFIRDRLEGTTVRVQPPAGCTTGGAALDPSGASTAPSLSGDGRYVAFVSLASNLVTGDSNGVADIFVLDRSTGLIARVLGEGDAQPNAASGFPQMSADGASVAFQSDATNLVADDTNGVTDIFVATNPFASGELPPGVTPLPTCSPTPTEGGETPTPTSTPPPTATVTEAPTASPTSPGNTPTPSQPATATATTGVTATSTPTTPNTPVATATPTLSPTEHSANTATPSATKAATATRTATVGAAPGGGGGGGGCSCRIDPVTGAVSDSSALPALALPLVLWLLRRRRGGSVR